MGSITFGQIAQLVEHLTGDSREGVLGLSSGLICIILSLPDTFGAVPLLFVLVPVTHVYIGNHNE